MRSVLCPLLWIIPLCIYLLSFVLTFRDKNDLTGFYLIVSPGGFAGSVIVIWIAPGLSMLSRWPTRTRRRGLRFLRQNGWR